MSDYEARPGYWVNIPNAPAGGPYCFWVSWPPRKSLTVRVLTTGTRRGPYDSVALLRRGELMLSDVGYRSAALGGEVYYSNNTQPGHYFRQLVDGYCGRFQENVRR